jgi:O-antigen/teichoic acid export membrane protein
VKRYLRQLLNESVVYGLSGVATSLVGFFLVPIYTRTFAPAEYGILSVTNATNALLGALLVCGLDGAASVWFWDNTEHADRQKTFSSWFAFNVVVAAAVSLPFVVASGPFSRLAFGTVAYARLWTLFGGTLFFTSFSRIANIWFRSLRKPMHAVGYSLAISVSTAALSIVFVVKLRWGLAGIFSGQFLAAVLGVALFFAMMRGVISVRAVSGERLRAMLRYSLPLVPSGIAFWLMNSASAYFLNAYCPREEVGFYQVGNTFASIVSLFTLAFVQAWGSFALSIATRSIAKDLYAFVGEVFVVFGLFIAFVVSVAAPTLLGVFATHRYAPARNVVGLLALNAIILAAPQVISIPFALVKKAGPYALAVGVGAAVTVPMFFLLVPRFGKEGAAIAVLLGNGLVPIFVFRSAQRLYPLPYAIGRMALGSALVIAAFLIDIFLDARGSPLASYVVLRKTALVVGVLSCLAIAYRGPLMKLLRSASDPDEDPAAVPPQSS